MMHSSSNESARSPRLTPKGDSVVYLSGIVGGPHAGCARLDEFSIVTGKSRVIVPIINIPGDDKFPGLYVKEVVRKCWVMGSEGACLILSSSWGFQTVILTINLKSGSITNLTLEGLSSWNFLGATSNGWLISSRSSPTEFQSIVCHDLTQDGLQAAR